LPGPLDFGWDPIFEPDPTGDWKGFFFLNSSWCETEEGVKATDTERKRVAQDKLSDKMTARERERERGRGRERERETGRKIETDRRTERERERGRQRQRAPQRQRRRQREMQIEKEKETDSLTKETDSATKLYVSFAKEPYQRDCILQIEQEKETDSLTLVLALCSLSCSLEM